MCHPPGCFIQSEAISRSDQGGISAHISDQTSFRWEINGGVTKCPLFSQASMMLNVIKLFENEAILGA